MAIPAPQPTKQQLDDLDALLQRMLSLPVSLPEEEFPPAETIPLPPSPSPLESRPQPPLPLISSVPADVLTPPPGNLVLTDPLSPSIPAEPEENPLRSVPDQRNTTEGVPHGPPQPVFAKPAPVLPPPTPEPWLPPVVPEERQVARPTFIARHPSSASSRPLEDPLWLLPVLWCNRLFDWLALGLGAPGHWLRGPIGRNLLGCIGLVLLLAALTLVILDHYELALGTRAHIMP